MRAGLSLGQTIAIAKALLTDAVTDIGVQDVVDLLTAHKRAFSSAATSFVTLPGKPLLSPTRLSYYVVSRASASSIVREYMFADGEFDPDRIFRNAKDPVFASVYDGGKG